MPPFPLPPTDDAYRYGPLCWACRGFYWRIHEADGRWLCNYCRFKHQHP